MDELFMSVKALPMSIWPQAMSYLRPSSDVALVRPLMACLVAVYGAEFGRGTWAEIEPLLMMRPPRGSWSFMILIACCVQKNAPFRFVPTTDSHFSGVRSSSRPGVPPPALLHNRSRRPKVSFVFVNRASTALGSPTSV